MNFPDPPLWTSNEKVELLTEVIRAANPDLLIEFIQAHRIQPSWADVALPRGRTGRQCEMIYNNMLRSGFSPRPIRSASVREPGPTSTINRPIQPEMAFMGGRHIQPRPQIASIDTMLQAESSEPPQKKRRGRPTNVERQMRAAERGEPFPPPPKRERAASTVAGPSTSRPVSAAILAAQAVMTPPPQPPPPGPGPHSTGTSESSSGKRKRGRPPKAELDARRMQESGVASPPQPTPSRYPDILTRDEPPPRAMNSRPGSVQISGPNPNPGTTQTSNPDELGMR